MEVVKFENLELQADFNLDTIWVTQIQLAELYKTTQENVAMHIKNIFNSQELSSQNVYKKILSTDTHGRNRNIGHYNLDMIIAVGYRVNSIVATRFRQWATKVLKREIQKQEANPLALAEAMLTAMKQQDARITTVEHRLDNTPVEIDGEKAGHLHNILSEYGRRLGNYSHGYGRFKRHYKLGSYKQLPLRLYDEAIELVESWHLELDETQHGLFEEEAA